MALTAKQRLFVEHYCATRNATEAARLAGYSEKTAYSIGSENLRKPEIAALVDAKLEEIIPKAEIFARLAEHARGSLEDFLVSKDEPILLRKTIDVETQDQGVITTTTTETIIGPVARLDLRQASERGLLHLIKKYKITDKGVEIELHDPRAALELLGKAYGMFVDKKEISGPNGGAVPIQMVEVVLTDAQASLDG